ncbi:MAG: cell envelope biogenesis protein OmpA [Acetobacteraceae bacterium]|nr:cell envelope biogenesis protein OmpA [Pseudomonadota bacterium]
MTSSLIKAALLAGLALGAAACTDPYDPGQRALGGAAIGAGTGAAVGAIAGGGRGAATGALIGGGVGALGGALTTPQR